VSERRERNAALLAVLAGALALAAELAWTPGHDGAPAQAMPVDGASLFEAKVRATCHDGPGTASHIEVGPSLHDAPDWAGSRVPGLSAEAYVRQSIRDPGAFISPAYRSGGMDLGMPLLAVSNEEVDALVAYLLHR
jgi:hypothetical protein